MERDIALSYDGGAILNDRGDLEATSGLDALSRKVSRIVKTRNPAWKLYPDIGANLEDFVGQPNTRETAAEMTKRLNYVLNKDQISGTNFLEVRVVPANAASVYIFIFLRNESGRITLSREVFDYKDGIFHDTYDPLESKKIIPVATHSLPTNKYLGG